MQSTPRVNSEKLSQYPSKTIKLVGQVLRFEGNVALIMAPDKGQVTVHLNPDTSLTTLFAEIIGRVNPKDNTIQELSSTNLGDKIDLDVANSVVELTHKYPSIFPVDA